MRLALRDHCVEPAKRVGWGPPSPQVASWEVSTSESWPWRLAAALAAAVTTVLLLSRTQLLPPPSHLDVDGAPAARGVSKSRQLAVAAGAVRGRGDAVSSTPSAPPPDPTPPAGSTSCSDPGGGTAAEDEARPPLPPRPPWSVYQLLLTTRELRALAVAAGAGGLLASGCEQLVGVSASASIAALGGSTDASLRGTDGARVISDAPSVLSRSCVTAAPGEAIEEDRRAKSRKAAGVVAAASGSTTPLSIVSADTKQLDSRLLLCPRWWSCCWEGSSSGCGSAVADAERRAAPAAGGEATGDRDITSDATVNSRASPSRTSAPPELGSASVLALPSPLLELPPLAAEEEEGHGAAAENRGGGLPS